VQRQLATCQEELTRINAELDSLTAETSSVAPPHPAQTDTEIGRTI
jgi:hypothetical protein